MNKSDTTPAPGGPRTASVPSSWFDVIGGWNPHSALTLRDEVDRRGIAYDDLPAVRAVWSELENLGRQRLADIADANRRDLAAVSRRRDEARVLSRIYPRAAAAADAADRASERAAARELRAHLPRKEQP